jgi:transcriptional regulator with XRE-family HTH domain
MPVPARENMDNETRQRFRRWLAWYRRTRYQDKTDQDLAKALGISGPILSTILSGKRTMGLDVFLKLQRVSGIPADVLIGTDPPGQA